MALLDSPARRKRKGQQAFTEGMGWAETFIAVDWGTTNRRAWRIADGAVGEEFEDGRGVLSVGKDDFPTEVADIRHRLGDYPLLMAGMVGSNRGWVEAPYVPCPAGLDDIAAELHWAEPGRTAIVPGLSSQEPPDVMRGEEVQIVGAIAARLMPGEALLCHPGTHNKWARVRDNRIASFRTVMTGEIFNLLREHSILADLLSGEMTAGAPFLEGVERGLATRALTADLFSARAAVLLGARPKADAGDFVSGLLIGADLAGALPDAPPGAVYVMGRPDLTGLYSAALQLAGREPIEIDGEAAFLAGINAIAGRL